MTVKNMDQGLLDKTFIVFGKNNGGYELLLCFKDEATFEITYKIEQHPSPEVKEFLEEEDIYLSPTQGQGQSLTLNYDIFLQMVQRGQIEIQE